jgi:hypothetical protein
MKIIKRVFKNKIGSTSSTQRSERCLLDAHWRLRRVEGDYNTYG